MMSQDGYYGSGCIDPCVAEQHNEVFLDLYAERGCGILVSCLIGRFHDWYAAYGLDEGFSSHSLQN